MECHKDSNNNVVRSYLDANERLSNAINNLTSSDIPNFCYENSYFDSSEIFESIENLHRSVEGYEPHKKGSESLFDGNLAGDSATAIFTTKGQARIGSHHGQGGRRVGSGFRVREKYRSYATTVLCGRMHAIWSDHPLNDSLQTMKRLVSDLKHYSELEGATEDLAMHYEKK